jgi:hypothetical protein
MTAAGCASDDTGERRELVYRKLNECIEVPRDSAADNATSSYTPGTEFSKWTFTGDELRMKVYSDATCAIFVRDADLIPSPHTVGTCGRVRWQYYCGTGSGCSDDCLGTASVPGCSSSTACCIDNDANRPERMRLEECGIATADIERAVWDDYYPINSNLCSGIPALRISHGTETGVCARSSLIDVGLALMVTACSQQNQAGAFGGSDEFAASTYAVGSATALTAAACLASTTVVQDAIFNLAPGNCLATNEAASLWGRKYSHKITCAQATTSPSTAPTVAPTRAPTLPTLSPTAAPTHGPTIAPTSPTEAPAPLPAMEQFVEDVGVPNLIGMGIGAVVFLLIAFILAFFLLILCYFLNWRKRGCPCCPHLDKQYGSQAKTSKADMAERARAYELKKIAKWQASQASASGRASIDSGSSTNPIRKSAAKKTARGRRPSLAEQAATADEGATAMALPPGWVALEAEDGEGTYYHHAERETTSWVHPKHIDDLPEHWTALQTDDGTGNVYFHNSQTDETSWTKPTRANSLSEAY